MFTITVLLVFTVITYGLKLYILKSYIYKHQNDEVYFAYHFCNNKFQIFPKNLFLKILKRKINVIS